MGRVIKRIELSPRSFSYELIVLQDYEGLPPNIENKSLIVVTLSLYINILCKERNCIAGFRPVNLTRTENVKRRNTGNSQENKRSETGHNMTVFILTTRPDCMHAERKIESK